jgi:type I restriction enzyme, S subunit
MNQPIGDAFESTFRLGDVCLKIGSGATPRGGSDVYQDSGVAIIRSQNVLNTGFRRDGLAFVNDEHAEQLAGVSVQAGDVLLNITGDSVARVCLAPGWVLPARVNQHVAIVRTDSNLLEPRFLRYFLASAESQSLLLGLASAGATRNALTKRMIEDLEVPAISIAEQRRIAGVLSALDEKIEHNGALADRLNRLVINRFRAYFPEVLGDALLGDHVDAVRGRSYKSEELAGSERALVTLKSFKRGGGYVREGLKPYSGDCKPEQIIQPGEVVVAHTDLTQAADVIGKPALVPDTDRFAELVASLDLAIVRPKSDRVSRLFLYHLLLSDEFQAHAYAHSNGSTVLHLSKDAIPSFKVSLPDVSQLKAFDVLAEPIVQRSLALEREGRVVGSIRDALLPKLVSGQIRVPPSYDPDDVLGTVAHKASTAA